MKIKLIVLSFALLTGCAKDRIGCTGYDGYGCMSYYTPSYIYANPSRGNNSVTVRSSGRNSYRVTRNR